MGTTARGPRTAAGFPVAALAVLLLGTGCGGPGSDGADEAATAAQEPVVSAAEEGTDPPAASSSTASSSAASSSTAPPPAASSGAPRLGSSCTSPEGWTVGYPDDWAVNAGDVAPACTRFGPEPFEVLAGTDARNAPVVLDLEPVAYGTAARPRSDERARRELTVDGRIAVRIERVTDVGLYPAGTPITSYVVDLGAGGDGPRTLVATAVGLPPFDHAADVAVLDAMVASLDLDAPS